MATLRDCKNGHHAQLCRTALCGCTCHAPTPVSNQQRAAEMAEHSELRGQKFLIRQVAAALDAAEARGRAESPCSCGHGDLSPNFHLHPCPIKSSYMAGIAVGRLQGRAEGHGEAVATIENWAKEYEQQAGRWRTILAKDGSLRAVAIVLRSLADQLKDHRADVSDQE